MFGTTQESRIGRIEDDLDLLRIMAADGERESDLFKPSALAQKYYDNIDASLAESDLDNLLARKRITEWLIIDGAGLPSLKPRRPLGRLAASVLEGAPIISRRFARYKSMVAREHARRIQLQGSLALLILDLIAIDFPELQIPAHLAVGGGEDLVSWRGRQVSAAWVEYLCQAADVYRSVGLDEVSSLLEIGPGLGLGTLSHLALNPNLDLIVNLDLSPALYVSTQYLKSFPQVEVIDYRRTRHLEEIEVRPGTRPRIYQLAVWQLPRLRGRMDMFVSAWAFSEMEPDLVDNYARMVKPLTRHAVVLGNPIVGHEPGLGGQREPVTMSFLEDLFADEFPWRTAVEDGWRQLYQRQENQIVIRRATRPGV